MSFAGHLHKMFAGTVGGQSRVVTPLTQRVLTPQPKPAVPPVPLSCPEFLAQLTRTSGVNNGGSGLINGTTFVYTTFNNPSGSGYQIRHIDLTTMTELAAYDAAAIYGDVMDFIEVDDDGTVYVWNTETGNLERYVISGSAYVYDATLRTGEVGLHASVYDRDLGMLRYVYLADGSRSRVDPSTGSATSDGSLADASHARMCTTSDGVLWAELTTVGVNRLGADTDIDLSGYGDKIYGFYPQGERLMVMVGPTDPDDDLRNVLAVDASGSVSEVSCMWQTYTGFDGPRVGGVKFGAGLRDGTHVYVWAFSGMWKVG